jgi:tetratricopeptide (TPR) repeat protein
MGRTIMLAHQKSHLKKSLIILGVALGAILGWAPYVSCSPFHPSPRAQGAAPVDVAAAANDAYEAKDWGAAARLYGQITVQQPQNVRAWYRLAVALDGQGQQDEAVAAFQKSIQAGVPAGIGEYGIALTYGSRQNNERAFEYLEKAAQDGFSDSARLAADPEMASLRSDPRFARVAEQAKRNAKPCAYNPLNRQFDFWVGEWEVVTADGANPAGTSKIELILGDCVIQENWTSGGNTGYEGKSYNIYNPDLHRWEQFWNDNAGGMIHFYGELKNGVMDYWTDEIPQKDGTKLKRHLQFIPASADKVRQFSQGSTDGGKTWHVEYDFIYNRKK